MRRGKEIAQGAHASLAFLVSRLQKSDCEDTVTIDLSPDEFSWIQGGETKICVQVPSEYELLDIHESALSKGISSHLIYDSGKTEFAGTRTLTACAIGPGRSDALQEVTGHLALY